MALLSSSVEQERQRKRALFEISYKNALYKFTVIIIIIISKIVG